MRTTLPFRATSRRLRRSIFSVVLLALVLAQSLGAIHRIVHSPLSGQGVVAASGWSAQPGSGWLQSLFAGHASEQGCDLYDQLSHADLIQPVVVAVVLLQPEEARVDAPFASRFAAPLADVRARGPPLTV